MKMQRRQTGAALLTALICLVLVSMIGAIAMRTSASSAKVAANAKQANQAMRMATSALNAFFIDPVSAWDLRTVKGDVTLLPNAVVNSVDIKLQARATGKKEFCPDIIGLPKKSGTECYYFKAVSNYSGSTNSDFTVAAGFLSAREQ